MAETIMIQGTMSNAGKSLTADGLCRVFKQDGDCAAPFKSGAQVIANGTPVSKDEESLSGRLKGTGKTERAEAEIAVIRLPGISDLTDFQVFSIMQEVRLRYVERVSDLGKPDMVLLPESKNTIEDLLWMRRNGLEAAIWKLAAENVPVFGICGGFKMLGESLSDPDCVESGLAVTPVRGMGLLPIRTVFGKEKTRTRVAGACSGVGGILEDLSGMEVEGYVIHMDGTTRSVPPLTYVMECQSGSHLAEMDGCQRGNIYGTCIHGFFDKEGIAGIIVNALIKKKRQPALFTGGIC